MSGSQQFPKKIFCERVHLLDHLHGEHRTRKGDKACFPKDGHLEGRDVAIANENLWASFDQRIINPSKDSRRSVSSSNSDDRFHMLVCKHRIEIRRPICISSGEVTVHLPCMLAEFHAVTEMFEVLNASLNLLDGRRSACRRNYADDIVFLETRRLEDVHGLLAIGISEGQTQTNIDRKLEKSKKATGITVAIQFRVC